MAQLNDKGIDIEVTFVDANDSALTVSGASTKQLKLLSPNASSPTTVTADFKTDGSDGILKYTTTSGTLNVVGTWRVQGYVVLATGFTGHTAVGTFDVNDNL